VAWQKVVEDVSFRRELMHLGQQPGTNVRQLCERFQVSRKTYYKWRQRNGEQAEAGLTNRSRRPRNSPNETRPDMQDKIMAMRLKYPTWGARKIAIRLSVLGEVEVPAVSTIHRILKQNGMISAEQSGKHHKWRRFEYEAPNQLWQMDFKGWFPTDDGGRCHSLTVLDDHSRYVVCLQACGNERSETVKQHLTATFRQYGMPEWMTMDNGAPWGNDLKHRHTPLTAWLMRLGIGVSHSRPYHPQTQGKDERFHRTLKADVLQSQHFRSLQHVQEKFDPYRDIYNHERPHQALAMEVPASRYQISVRSFPEALPAIEYDAIDEVRRVMPKGFLRFQRKRITVGKAFAGYSVAVRPTTEDGVFDVYFCRYRIGSFDIREEQA
jgi:transposase InsO family protein